MIKKKIEKIFTALSKKITKPTTELKYSSNFELLIAVLLSARSTDKTVNKITDQLFSVANTPQKLQSLGINTIKKYIKSIGFYNNKSKNIIKICDILINRYNSCIPETREELESQIGRAHV